MSMMEAAASSFDVHVLRRAQSAGNLPGSGGTVGPPALSTPRRHASEDRAQAIVRGLGRTERLRTPPRTPTMATAPLPPEAARIHDPQWPWNVPPPPPTPRPQPRPQPQNRQQANQPNSAVDKLLVFIGYSGDNAKERRGFLSVCWSLTFSFAEFVIIITLLAYSAHAESPTHPGLSEWRACSRPLGVWDALWLIRVALGSILSYWGWRRDCEVRRIQERRRNGEDIESPAPPGRAAAPPGYRPPPRYGPPANSVGATGATDPNDPNAEPPVHLPHTHLYSRLTLLGTFMSLAWFLTAHILEYTSINDCRHSSPHLWWLTFGILCILYIMIMEIFLLGLLVFVFGPVIYVLWNIVLLCLGRHPLQNPHYIKPDIGKLPKSIVDQIPLVLYIPPPPDEPVKNSNKPIVKPSVAYTYPPKRPEPSRPPRRRFAFLRRKKDKDDANKSQSAEEKPARPSLGWPRREKKMSWEEQWEPSEYPFVRLEGNRAVCAICLLDFEEPKRTDGAGEGPGAQVDASADAKASPVAGEGDRPVELARDQQAQEVQVEEVTQEERDRLHLDDAGEGAQPLRLLHCGHVFHQTCVDPWLIDVSGRCPVCQRPVEIPEPSSKKKRRNQRTP
ncbi:hypothetical protein WOLCODRAFT_104118 [Wolfiporia cocos MD-104 SS10]|uniref:RING-type domain-containing protein n=1 Tax=Wolfiporia cocos (strain MD-104) TaxID=742152 RepID=A0A2H3K5Q0_WOLCO|nr:hypothetical protein WOLCODRAFT_104118 [Wolfiporia cocos MD-104 SS10]